MRNTLKSGADIDRLFTSGNKIKTRNLIVLFNKAADGCGQHAFIAGKRLGVAPLRNRAKRRMREAVARVAKKDNAAQAKGQDIVFVARQNTAKCSFAELVGDVAYAQRKVVKVGTDND